MCRYDHGKANLLKLDVESIAPHEIFTRLLIHHDDLNLTDEQIHGLLSIMKDYRRNFARLLISVKEVADEVDELINERYPVDVKAAQSKIEEHGELIK